MLEFSAMKKNLSIMLDMERVFLDCLVLNVFCSILVLHSECFWSGKELVGVKGVLYLLPL